MSTFEVCACSAALYYYTLSSNTNTRLNSPVCFLSSYSQLCRIFASLFFNYRNWTEDSVCGFHWAYFPHLPPWQTPQYCPSLSTSPPCARHKTGYKQAGVLYNVGGCINQLVNASINVLDVPLISQELPSDTQEPISPGFCGNKNPHYLRTMTWNKWYNGIKFT